MDWFVTLKEGKRYAHTATTNYQVTLASLQPKDKVEIHGACDSYNINRQKRHNGFTAVVVEHNFEENIICVLREGQVYQTKLDLLIRAGEQVAYYTVGDGLVRLSGMCLQ